MVAWVTVYCFTAWGHTIHALWNEKRETVRYAESGLPKDLLDRIDGGFCIGAVRDGKGWRLPPFESQISGCFCVHYHDSGWTILAAWDRSGEDRANSNTVFIIKGFWPGKTGYQFAKQAFPTIWERMKLGDTPLDFPG